MAIRQLSTKQVVNLANDPASGTPGEIYYNTSTNAFKYYNGSSWVALSSGGVENSFTTIDVPNGTDPVADSGTDTLTFTESNGLVITGNSSTDSIQFSTNATPLNTASTIISRDADQAFDITAIDFDTTDTIASATGRLSWNDGEGTLSLGLKGGNLNLEIGQENIALCYNGTGSQINKGSVVYISGAQGQRPSISLADADAELTSSKTFGIVAENIANGNEGFVATFGIVPGINTSGFTEGQALWLSSTPGQLTNIKPDSPSHLVFIGYCLHVNESSGRIFVNPQNGYEVDELHDVLITSVADNHILSYDNSTSLWKNQGLAAAIQEVDGASSGIDADLLDGQHGSHYLDWTNTTNKPDPTITLGGDLSGSVTLTDLGNGTLTATVADNSHNHTSSNISDFTEATQDVVGGMVSSNTESGISVTYDDTNGKLNFDVNDPTITLSGDVTGSGTITNLGNVTITATVADDSHNHVISNVDGLQTALDAKAPLASPALTGTPTAPTAAAGTNTTQIATTAFVQTATAALVDAAPTTLDTLNELAAALGDDPNFATTVSTALGNKQPLDADLTAIAGLAGTSGFLKKTAADTWALDTNSYLTGNQTITLTGDVSGSGTTSISVTVADDSHNHIISNVDGLQTALDAKAPLASPTFTGQMNITNASPTSFNAIRGSRFGYSSSYKVMVLGDVTPANFVTVSFGYDPIANTNSSFSGDGREVLFRNAVQFMTPNTGDDGYLKPMKFTSAGSVQLNNTPIAPTAAVNTNTTQIATTAFVVGQAGTASPLVNGTVAVGTSLLYSRQDHVHPTDTSRAADSAVVHLAGTETITGAKTFSATTTFTGNVNISGVLDLTNTGVISALDMSNNSITGVNTLSFADPGASEGITWTGGNGWYIYESPDNLTNAAGNLQIVQNSTRRATFKTDGTFEVVGALIATSKSFDIQHPTKENMRLRYGSLESPYHGINLTGESFTKKGICKVELPDYIHGLVKRDGINIQLTNIGHGKVMWIEDIDIENNNFIVKTKSKKECRFFWSLVAIRKDIDDLVVEYEKDNA